MYLPYFLSWVIMASIIYNLFTSSGGVMNRLLQFLNGGEKIQIISNPDYFRAEVYISMVWKGVGFGSIIYLAAIAGVNAELYEAAIIDGANRLQRVWFITLPSIKSVIVLLLILDVGGIMNAGFDQIFNLYSPQVYTWATSSTPTFTGMAYQRAVLLHDGRGPVQERHQLRPVAVVNFVPSGWGRKAYYDKRSAGDWIFDSINYLFLGMLGLVTLFPFWNVMMTSLVGSSEYYSKPVVLWPSHLNITAYLYIFSTNWIGTGFGTTLSSRCSAPCLT